MDSETTHMMGFEEFDRRQKVFQSISGVVTASRSVSISASASLGLFGFDCF